MSYGVVDLILIISSLFALLMVHAYLGGKFSAFWITVILGFLLFLVGILFAIYNIPYTEDIKPYTYIDLIWTAGYLFLTYGMLDIYSHIRTIHQEMQGQQS